MELASKPAMRVLVLRLTSMGDVVLTLPAVNDMLENVPGITVDWMVEKPFAPIVQMHPKINLIHIAHWRKWRKALLKTETRSAIKTFRHKLQSVQYDVVIDFQGQIAKSILLGKMARGPLMGFAKQGLREPLAALFYRKKGAVSKSLHLVPRSRALAAQIFGYANPTSPARYGITAGHASWLPSEPDKKYAVLIPHRSRPEAPWPLENWIAISHKLKALGLNVAVLWGSPAEEALSKELATQVGGEVPPFLTVAHAAALLEKAQLVVGLDTGFTHLATALERPTIALHCDFDPKLAGLVGSAFHVSMGGGGAYASLKSVEQQIDLALASHSN